MNNNEINANVILQNHGELMERTLHKYLTRNPTMTKLTWYTIPHIILNVEKGRYTRPRTPLNERLCNMCNWVDDELHFITECAVNVNERRALSDMLIDKFPEFEHLCDLEKFVFFFIFDDAQMLSWLGKFLYKSFRSKSVQTECLQDTT